MAVAVRRVEESIISSDSEMQGMELQTLEVNCVFCDKMFQVA